MHTPIGVKPVAGSKEWREAWQKRAFAHISNCYKHIYIAVPYTQLTLPTKA
ncbi:hypothetical protein [Escherichia coli]|uniref:hypothetical protein n=1 Tax=Escherichia coli TaxID=562 RepID=UPI00397E783F